MILCLDFDGVLHSYSSGWRGARSIPDPPVPGAMEFLTAAVEHFDVAVHSSRARYWGGRRAMRIWLQENLSVHFWEEAGDVSGCYAVGDREEEYSLRSYALVSRISFPLWKPPAHVTLDDRALTFTGTFPGLQALKDFKPWNKP